MLLQKTEKCPVCQGISSQILYELNQSQTRLLVCNNCQTIFYTPRPTPQELANFYNSSEYRHCYENSTMTGLDFAKARYQELIKIINSYHPSVLSIKNKKLLDVGCGVGDLLTIASKDNWDVTGTEISPEATMEANRKLDNKVLTGDLLSLDLPNNSYDLITIYHVIEHLISPTSILEKIYQLLKPGGVAFVETPNIASLGARIKKEKWSNIKPPEHITYFKPNSLKYVLSTVGFEQYNVFTNAPHIVESTENWNPALKFVANLVYKMVPYVGMGATLQAIAIKTK